MIYYCAHCGKENDKYIGDVNRAIKLGRKLFCNRTCFGLDRRKSIEEKKMVKAAYDKKISNNPARKKQRQEYFKKDYASKPEKYKAIRQAKYPKHLQYLQTPKYKEWKKEYDEKYRAAKLYGEFSEAALVLKKLEENLDSQRIKRENGITFNKSSQQRKRKWNNLLGKP